MYRYSLAQSGISTSFEGKYGSVRYWLKGEVEKPWSFNHKTKKAFTVISHIDINRSEYLVSDTTGIRNQMTIFVVFSGSS